MQLRHLFIIKCITIHSFKDASSVTILSRLYCIRLRHIPILKCIAIHELQDKPTITIAIRIHYARLSAAFIHASEGGAMVASCLGEETQKAVQCGSANERNERNESGKIYIVKCFYVLSSWFVGFDFFIQETVLLILR